MRSSGLVLIVGLVLLGSAVPADAQTRRTTAQRRAAPAATIPDTDMWAISGSIGAAAPSDPSLEAGLQLAGTIERYLSPRLSIRGQGGASWWDIQDRNFAGSITPVFFDANLVYNWERGNLHPFVTGGVGFYHFHASENATRDRSDNEPGFNLGGGTEVFFSPRTTLVAEIDYHKVGDIDTPLATFSDGSFWRFGVGLKKYF